MEKPLYAYEYASVDFETAVERLSTSADELLGGATSAGTEHASDVVAQMHAPIAGLEVGRDVRIEVGEVVRDDDGSCTVPLRWQAEDGALLFPHGDATLELVALSKATPRTQVTLAGSYRPPLGIVGAVGDAVVGHRVAEATAKRFVEDVARRLEENG